MAKRIFIIEDDINVSAALQAKLSHDGFAVETDPGADETENILSRLGDFGPDYVIMDLMLPYADGPKLLSAIRAGEGSPPIPVFIFTDISDRDAKAMGERLGADYYFIKTELNIDEFVAKIEKIMNNLPDGKR